MIQVRAPIMGIYTDGALSGLQGQDFDENIVIPGLKPRLNSLGRLMWGGRFGDFDMTASKTWEIAVESPIEFDAVRPILAASRATAGTIVSPNVLWQAAAATSFANAASDNAAWVAGTSGGNGVVALNAAAAVMRKAYVATDFASVTSVPRDDGGKGFIAAVRVYAAGAAGNISIFGDGVDSYANWNTRTDGHRRRMRVAPGNFASANQAGFGAAAADAKQCPIVGVELMLRGKVINVHIFGDSIDDSRSGYFGGGWALKACDKLAAITGIPVMLSAMGWPGSNGAQQRDSIIDLLAAGYRPDLCNLTAGSINDLTPGNIDVTAGYARSRLAGALAALAGQRIPRAMRTILPVNPAAKNFGAGEDARRQQLNAEAVARVGEIIWDATPDFNGAADADGQIGMLAGTHVDDIHPGEFGETFMADRAVQAWVAALV